MMYEPEQSDLCVVAKKPANDGEGSTSELVERRRRAKGNIGKTYAYRTLSRVSVSPGPVCVRERARRMLAVSSLTQGGSRVPESGPLGSVRGRPAMGVPTAILRSPFGSGCGRVQFPTRRAAPVAT